MLVPLLLGHLFAGAFLHNLAIGVGALRQPALHSVAELVLPIARLFEAFALMRVLAVVILLMVILATLRGRGLSRMLDLCGALLLVRCAAQFLVLNLLLLAPLRSGGLLLAQLVLFLPVITVVFGWLYWRMDTGARRQGRSHLHLQEGDRPPGLFDYFHVAATTLVQFEPSGASADTRLMKALFLLHGVVMLDLVALTLSRAIALAAA